jgi:hypothetical protein
MITTEIWVLVPTAYEHICYRQFCESTEPDTENFLGIYIYIYIYIYISHRATDQILELPVHVFCRYAADIAS